MSIKEISQLLKKAKRPIQLFGPGTKEEVNAVYKKYVKVCYPDFFEGEAKELALEVTKDLNLMKELADKELEEGIYALKEKKDIYAKKKPIIEFEIEGEAYKFYEHVRSEEIAEIYEGLVGGKRVYLKVGNDEAENKTLEDEFEILSTLDHPSFAKAINLVKINGFTSIILEAFEGLELDELKEQYGNMPGEHIAWFLERALCAVGYLHSNNIIHGNIKKESILINPEIHNVMFSDLSLCITEASEPDSKYKVINLDYTPSYVTSTARTFPSVDIFAIGKAAIYLMGGDIKTNGMPLSCDSKIREFIRKLMKPGQNDAWALWDEIRELRTEIYGTERFKKLERKL